MTPKGRLLAAVFVGGVLGTLARAGLAEAVPFEPGHWPWGTFVANLIGAALLGAVAERWDEVHDLRSLLGAGICGSLTTFSTLQLEVFRMLESSEPLLAAGYVTATLLLGFAMLVAGKQFVLRRAAP